MNPTDIEAVLHEKHKAFSHNTISQAERWAFIGQYINTQEGKRVNTYIVVEAVRYSGLLFLQVLPAELGVPKLN